MNHFKESVTEKQNYSVIGLIKKNDKVNANKYFNIYSKMNRKGTLNFNRLKELVRSI